MLQIASGQIGLDQIAQNALLDNALRISSQKALQRRSLSLRLRLRSLPVYGSKSSYRLGRASVNCLHLGQVRPGDRRADPVFAKARAAWAEFR